MAENFVSNLLIPELLCADFNKSLNFYTEILGFQIRYDREEGFAMLEREGVQIMLDQNRSDNWVSGPLEYPYGRGINLQIQTTSIIDLYESVKKANARIYLPLKEEWYQANEIMLGCLQFIVFDIDGYMLRFFQDIGTKPV
ncbi:Bleomycin resistance protein [Sporomusa ovata DSM 2662]|uniref:VOC family protein n=1 Tax=Sporomusa ovata TaxID=2378 RepID=UPI0003885164|nr:VOC family protein [Sporomusa ovata]EQB25296.1 glyoxalase-like protein [Sporomusa ovata DSM 2662]